MTKPIVNMNGHKHGIGGYNYGCRCDVCKEAKATKRKEYQSSKSWEYTRTYLQRMRENDPEKYRAWLDKNNAYKKASFKADPEKHRWSTIHKKYKLTKQMYLDLLEQQNGVCAICQNLPKKQWLAVDHDHACCPGIKTCGECVRGLLCGACNAFIGRINENPQNLLDYLGKAR
jgi:Recombination endonuclease VII